jgi:peptidoglycan/LPS O-acetylase OafA/YrhL
MQFRVSVLAVGVCLAYIVQYNYGSLIVFLQSRLTLCISVLLLGLMLGFGVQFLYFNHEIWALAWGALVGHIVCQNKPTFLDNKPLNFLGKISYGFYMWHTLAIVLALKLCSIMAITNYVAFYFFSFLGSVALATLSYYGIEKPFIALKKY